MPQYKNNMNEIYKLLREFSYNPVPFFQKNKRVQLKYATILTISVLILVVIISAISASIRNRTYTLTPVMVTNEMISEGTVITADMIKTIEIPKIYIPENTLTKSITDNLQIAQITLPKNHILTNYDTKTSINTTSLIAQLDSGMMAFTLDESWSASDFPSIQKFDYVKIFISNPKSTRNEVVEVVSHAKVLEVIRKSATTPIQNITIEVTEEESKNLVLAYSNKYTIVVTLSN